MADRPRWALQRIVGTGSTEELLIARINLPGPATEILELRKTVLIDTADVTLENAILQGRLRVRYVYPEARSSPVPGAPATAHGPLMLLSAELGFTRRIPVPGATPEMTCTVVDAHVTADASVPAELDSNGRLTAVLDRSLILLSVRVLVETDTALLPPHSPVQAAPVSALVKPPPQNTVISRFASMGRRGSRQGPPDPTAN